MSDYGSNDRLSRLFELQLNLQNNTYNVDFQRMLDADRIQFIKDMKLAASAELQEALDEIGWKPWSTNVTINRDAYFGELVDLFHFFMNLLLVLGDDPKDLAQELFTRYTMKHRINVQRQNDGYDGVSTKCPLCRRALDDVGIACNTTKIDQPPHPVLDGYCADRNIHYYWINTVGPSGKVDTPMVIPWPKPPTNPTCGECHEALDTHGCELPTWDRWGNCVANVGSVKNIPPIKIPT